MDYFHERFPLFGEFDDEFEIASKSTLQSSTIADMAKKASQNPNGKFLVEIPDLFQVSSEELSKFPEGIKIKVTGPYTDEFLSHFTKHKQSLLEASIYTKQELLQIVKLMEEIESKIPPNMSKTTKLGYICNELAHRIKYDFKNLNSNPGLTHSLRGLFTGEAVCGGYSFILQQLLTRQGIWCDFVIGDFNGPHAWNVVYIDGKPTPVDLTKYTKEIQLFDMDTVKFLGQVTDFREYKPSEFAKLKNYEGLESLSQTELMKGIGYGRTRKNQRYSSMQHIVTKEDGSKFLLCLLSTKKVEINGQQKTLYNYYYAPIDEMGKMGTPQIITSEDNFLKAQAMIEFYNKKRTLKSSEIIEKQECEGIVSEFKDSLLSSQNLERVSGLQTRYVGGTRALQVEEQSALESLCSYSNIKVRNVQLSNGMCCTLTKTSLQNNNRGLDLYYYKAFIVKNMRLPNGEIRPVLTNNFIASKEELFTMSEEEIRARLEQELLMPKTQSSIQSQQESMQK